MQNRLFHRASLLAFAVLPLIALVAAGCGNKAEDGAAAPSPGADGAVKPMDKGAAIGGGAKVE